MLKYNWLIIGHEKQLKQIENDIEHDNLSHAYLLVGSDSIGKYSIAKRLAGIIQCDNNFCQKCATCLQIKNGSHIDTFEVNDNGESIKIEDVRNLISRLNMTRQSGYKICLIDGLERMTLEAANSFLKILEEPPSRTIFIMTTSSLESLLETIVSRVRTIKFQSMPIEYLREKLRELFPETPEELINQASLFSLGKAGKAVDLIEKPEVLAGYLKTYNEIQNFLEVRSLADRFSYVENLLENDGAVDTFFEILVNVLRAKILKDEKNKSKYINALSKIQEAGMLLKKNVNARLVLENLMLAL